MATLDEDIKKSMRVGINGSPDIKPTPVQQGSSFDYSGVQLSNQADPGSEIRGNVIPADARNQGVDNPTPQKAWTSFQGIGGENIYRNTNVDESKYGQAIYSDSSLGALPGGFDKDIQQNGVGSTGLDAEGNSTGTFTPFSSPIQSPEMQQKAGGIEMAGVNPVGSGSPFGQNQYGNVGQGTNGINVINQGSSGGAWWNKPRNQRGGDVASLMKRMPYGTAGDRAKRRSMIAQAGIMQRENESSMRNKAEADRLSFDYANMGSKNALDQQKMGIDAYNAGSSRISSEASLINANKPIKQSSKYFSISGGTDVDGNKLPDVIHNNQTGLTIDQEQEQSVINANAPKTAYADAANLSEEEFMKKYGG